MFFHIHTRSKRVGFTTTLSILFLLPLLSARAEVGLRIPFPKTPLVPLVVSKKAPPTSISLPLSAWPLQYPKPFAHTVTIDSTGEYVTVSQRVRNWNTLIPQILSLQDYLSERSRLEAQNQWRDYATRHITPTKDQAQRGRGITIETPEIKSKAFQRVFGGQTLSLNVTGQITIDGGMRNEKRSYVRDAVNRAPSTNFQMKQTQRFNVEGKIGENVSVFIDQDSERPFEFENAIKLKYSSDEDGIIKSIEAGNVGLSLPSTRFVTFSAKNSGLFGIKSEMKVGRLDITAIASMEKGEKNSLSITGGSEKSTYQIQDYEYKRSTYFFLDTLFRKQYPILDNGLHTSTRTVTDVELYKSDYNYQNKSEATRGWAVLNPTNPDTTQSDQENFAAYFIRLEPSDYFINRELGYIAMNMPLQNSEILAVAFRDSVYGTGETHQYGTLLAQTSDTTATPIFKIIKPREPRPADQTWKLAWKNVYSLGGRNIDPEGFDVKIYFKPPSGDPQPDITIVDETRGYLNIFGLDNIDINGDPNPDDVIDFDPNILSLSRGELIFPDLRPFDPEGDSDLPEDKRTWAIYDTTSTSYQHQQSKFFIEVKSSSRSTTYSLGMNVIEGSDEVLLNGTKLQKDIDYTIDYFSGALTLLSEEATNPNADLVINYESQRLFSIDKKSLMGARAEYTLWEEGPDRSFIGATLLYLSQTTLDQRIRVGKEAPMRNLVWDLNTKLTFRPDFLSRAMESIPFLHATGPSSISLEGEFAQVIPTPNTLNSETTGDPNGVAYIDDFEGAKRHIPLGVIRTNWGPSSPPLFEGNSPAELSRQGRIIWYNPFNMVSIQEIWPDREVTTNYGGTDRIQVLTLEFTPNDTLNDPRNSWAGVQRALSTAYADQTDSRFLEVWVQGDYGQLHVDLGRVSEDVIPNQKLNTEDKRRGGFLNNVLDDDEDTGLDGMFGPDPPDPFYPHQAASVTNGTASPYDFWDLNGNSTKEPGEPWSYDTWQYTSKVEEYSLINGTEDNKDDASGGRYPDTEDLNLNGDVDLNNDYFEFTFSLKKDHPDTLYIAGGEGNANDWRLYRIPLDDPSTVVGNPDWSRIEFVRIWVDDVYPDSLPTINQGKAYITFAEINLVGNEWKLMGVAAPGDSTYNVSDDSTLTIAVINTHDNPGYESPPGVEGLIDPVQKIQAKEQSLVIQLTDLNPGATAIAQKQFFRSQNLINYHTLKMFVHGGDIQNRISISDSIKFFLRWGSDTQNEHYYEVRLPVCPGWDDKNNIKIDFETLSRLKITMEGTYSDTISQTQENGHTVSVFGKPSLTNIRWFIIGVKNNGGTPFTGQVWIDELRLSNVRKDKGIAMRARADIKLSDFMTLHGEFNRKDADFHTVNERFGRGSNMLSGTVNTSIQLHKLLPTEWGVSLPLTANFSKSRQTPKYLPGSDILVNESTAPDSLLRVIRTESDNKGLNVSYSKRTKSRNFWVRYLIDPINGSFNYKQTDMSSSQTKYSKNLAYQGFFKYNLSFGNQYYWQPFKWLGQKGVLKKIAEAKFYYLPSNVSFNVSGNNNTKDSETRGGVASQVSSSKLNRGFSTSLRPFQVLSLDFSRTQTSDMRHSKWPDIFTSTNPGVPLSMNQNFNTNLNPKIFSWLTNTFKYSANYRWSDNPQTRNRGTSQSAGVSTDLTITGNFNPQKFVQSFHKKTSRPSRQILQPVTQRREGQKSDQPDAQKKTDQKKPSPLLSLLSLMGDLLQKIDPISVSMSQGRSANNYGILATPSFAYQIGTTLNPDVPTSPGVTQPNTSKKDHRFSIRSGFKITSQLIATLDYNYSSSENQSTQITGNISKSRFVWKGKDFPFPNWSLQWRGLEKLPLLSLLTQSVSLSHDCSGKKTETWNTTRGNITQETTSRDFRPLLGLTLTFKLGITANVQYATSESISEQRQYSQGKTKRVSSDLSITTRYSRRGGIRIPFFKKKLENAIDFSLTFTSRYNAIYQSREAGEEFREDNKTSETKNWSFKPTITYTFSRTVRGGMYLELGKREDKRIGTTEIKGFGINMAISLSG